MLPRYDAANHAGSCGEETIYAIPIEGAAVATYSTKAASTATGMQAAGAAGNGQSAARKIGRFDAVPPAAASTAGTAVHATGAAGSRATVCDMGVSSYDKAKVTSSPADYHAAAGASSAIGHYQAAAKTGSRGDYRDVVPNDDQYRDVTPNDDQYRDVTPNDDQRAGSGHGSKHNQKHTHGAARAAKKASAGTSAGTGDAQKLAGKNEYNIAAAAGAQRVGADQGRHTKRPAKKHGYLDILSSTATSSKAASTATGTQAASAAGNGQSAAEKVDYFDAVPSDTAGATAYGMGVSSYDKANGSAQRGHGGPIEGIDNVTYSRDTKNAVYTIPLAPETGAGATATLRRAHAGASSAV